MGNPPFLGGWVISGTLTNEYLEYLRENYPQSGGQADLVAYFFRRAFNLLGGQGNLGLIATNSIYQGDTRATGLEWICLNGGTIYDAQKRFRWTGAAVIISVVHIAKWKISPPYLLNRRKVDLITAYLFRSGTHSSPERLFSNKNLSFKGTMIYGMGFTFDDTSQDTTPISEMERLIAKDPRNSEIIFPYIGGEEINSSPTHSFHRYVINFKEMEEEEARRYPDLFEIVEEKVKPGRLKQKEKLGLDIGGDLVKQPLRYLRPFQSAIVY